MEHRLGALLLHHHHHNEIYLSCSCAVPCVCVNVCVCVLASLAVPPVAGLLFSSNKQCNCLTQSASRGEKWGTVKSVVKLTGHIFATQFILSSHSLFYFTTLFTSYFFYPPCLFYPSLSLVVLLGSIFCSKSHFTYLTRQFFFLETFFSILLTKLLTLFTTYIFTIYRNYQYHIKRKIL